MSRRIKLCELILILSGVFILIRCGAPASIQTTLSTPISLMANTMNPPILVPTQTVVALQSHNAADYMKNIIPTPVSVIPSHGTFVLSASTQILVTPDNAQLVRIGNDLGAGLRRATGLALPVRAGTQSDGNIFLTLGNDPTLGEEGYELTISPSFITLQSNQPAGLFYGVQTLRQLLPPSIESSTTQPGPWQVAAGTIRDVPRFEWRGAMLDVARHFFPVQDVKRYIDMLAYYKINRFHLHLTDDQGWRIEIKSWGKLATYGGSTEVGGGTGGYYTQEEYKKIVNYAAQRYMTVVPEIDMPGHTNAALASYPELNCSGVAPDLFTGTQVGFSTLCAEKEITYQFVDDVVRELAALTPGPYIHVGGDEARSTEKEDYIRLIERVQEIVRANGKLMIGWEEIGQTKLLPCTVAQHWTGEMAAQAAQQGAQIIVSPASKSYLDMKYDGSTKLGLDWAGLVDVMTAYNWEPTTEIEGVGAKSILGVEAPLWSETLETLDDIEYMAFPRLPGIAEIGWSPQIRRSWDEYVERLAAHGARLKAMDINFFASPQVPWK